MLLNIWVNNMNKNKAGKIAIVILFIIIIFAGLCIKTEQENRQENLVINNQISYDITNIPEYSGDIYVLINNNIPDFSNEDINIQEDHYSNLEDGRVRKGYDKN